MLLKHKIVILAIHIAPRPPNQCHTTISKYEWKINLARLVIELDINTSNKVRESDPESASGHCQRLDGDRGSMIGH